MQPAPFYAHPFARTEILSNFDLPFETLLSWQTRGCTLYTVHNEIRRDRGNPLTEDPPMVEDLKIYLLRMLEVQGRVPFGRAALGPQTQRAVAELVAARYAEDVISDDGSMLLIVKPAGLDAAAKLPR